MTSSTNRLHRLFYDEYGMRIWAIVFIIMGSIIAFVFPIIYFFSWLPEVNLVNGMNCTQLHDYIINNSNSGYLARTSYEQRCHQ
jgi:hypothetical protein